ncbi:hypothetical protein AOE01nite_08660 [Acetobacter oeni]|uniref:Uncharacterized protein n=1 Tax=Acetobacter oeni TaxID=304077 RepID=A0A511XI69_9PROT|nr:hypothetical protein AOE01nite_08660 [Acetobacter oeni]
MLIPLLREAYNFDDVRYYLFGFPAYAFVLSLSHTMKGKKSWQKDDINRFSRKFSQIPKCRMRDARGQTVHESSDIAR